MKILMVEDSSADSELILRELQRSGFDIKSAVVHTPEGFRRQLKTDIPDIVLADYNLGQWRGMEAVQILQEENLDIPLILVSGAIGDKNAVECIKGGAKDYVLKDALARLPVSVQRALHEKHLRDELRQTMEALAAKVKELARSNEELEQFAYVASHDLQEPLRMVASYTQLLAERYRSKLDEQADKYIRYAVEGAIRMQALIQDLLAFSRVGRHGLEMKPVLCDLAVAGALTNLQAAIEESHAIVVQDPLPVVLGNAVHLQQVFQNLIGNAIKFRGADVPLIHLMAEKEESHWLFTVQDNGIGIAAEHAETIFTIFTRLHRRSDYSGNGIGLAICKKIIAQHGGKIWAESCKAGGTAFHFTLPMHPPLNQEHILMKAGSDDAYAPSLIGG